MVRRDCYPPSDTHGMAMLMRMRMHVRITCDTAGGPRRQGGSSLLQRKVTMSGALAPSAIAKAFSTSPVDTSFCSSMVMAKLAITPGTPLPSADAAGGGGTEGFGVADGAAGGGAADGAAALAAGGALAACLATCLAASEREALAFSSAAVICGAEPARRATTQVRGVRGGEEGKGKVHGEHEASPSAEP